MHFLHQKCGMHFTIFEIFIYEQFKYFHTDTQIKMSIFVEYLNVNDNKLYIITHVSYELYNSTYIFRIM